jgi:lysophospholipase L1-like esterase
MGDMSGHSQATGSTPPLPTFPEAAGPSPARRRSRVGRAVAATVVLALLASVAGNVLLYRHAAQTYRQLSETQLDPYGLRHPAFPPDAPAAGAGELPVVVFFGDSRARDWPAPAVRGFRFVNRGVGGQTTAQVLGRLDAHVAPLSPQVVVVQAGINDLKAIPLFPHRRAEIVADCVANLRAVVRQAAAGGAVVVVATVFPPGDPTLDRRLVWSPDVAAAVAEVNATLRTLDADRVVVFDAWAVLAEGGRLRDGYGVDTLHLSARGYAALNDALAPLLKTRPASGTMPSAGGR